LGVDSSWNSRGVIFDNILNVYEESIERGRRLFVEFCRARVLCKESMFVGLAESYARAPFQIVFLGLRRLENEDLM